MAAFRSDIVDVRLVRSAPIVISVDELLRTKLISLLQVESTSVTKGHHCSWISTPEWGGSRMTVWAAFSGVFAVFALLSTMKRWRRTRRTVKDGRRWRWGTGWESMGKGISIQWNALIRRRCIDGGRRIRRWINWINECLTIILGHLCVDLGPGRACVGRSISLIVQGRRRSLFDVPRWPVRWWSAHVEWRSSRDIVSRWSRKLRRMYNVWARRVLRTHGYLMSQAAGRCDCTTFRTLFAARVLRFWLGYPPSRLATLSIWFHSVIRLTWCFMGVRLYMVALVPAYSPTDQFPPLLIPALLT